MVRLQAAMHRLPSDAVFSGRTAAWLHGLDVAPCSPIEVTVPISGLVTRLVGLSIRRCVEFDGSTAKGLPVTSRVQTVADLGRRAELIESVVILDMALHKRLVSLSELTRWADAHQRIRSIACLRRAVTLAEPATESPMETVYASPLNWLASRGLRSRCRFATSPGYFWLGQIFTIPIGVLPSSTTAPRTVRAWPRTTGARIDWSTRAIASSVQRVGCPQRSGVGGRDREASPRCVWSRTEMTPSPAPIRTRSCTVSHRGVAINERMRGWGFIRHDRV